jgi:hypothetical protein
MASNNNFGVRRIFGGKFSDIGSYAAPDSNSQAVAETLPVGTTRRVFRGPRHDSGIWSYHVNCAEAGAATSSLKFYFSDLPNPDPTVAAHWKDSGITAIDLAVVATTFATRTGDYPEWIMAEAVVVTNTADVWAYVRVAGVQA